MDEITIKLIYDIKKPKDEWYEEGATTHADIAIRSLMEYSGCNKSTYSLYILHKIVRQCFVNYLTTAKHIQCTLNDYYECLDKRIINGSLFYPNTYKKDYTPKDITEFEIEAMLTALQLTQVKTNTGEFINGFWDYEWNKGE